MPSTSKPQARLMAARAHGANFPMAKKIPLQVAKEFNHADKGGGLLGKSKPKKSPLPALAPKDNRAGRLSNVATDRGKFRFKANRKGE